MRRLIWFLIIFGFLYLVFFVINSQKVSETSSILTIAPTSSTPSNFTFGKVTKVFDGDTIQIETGEKIRYIGIDTSEIYPKVECYSEEAKKENENLVLGKTIKLERDISETDKYGRLLRYVYIENEMVNDKLVKNGAAKIETVPPDIKYKQKFLESEKYAMENKLGLWGKCF